MHELAKQEDPQPSNGDGGGHTIVRAEWSGPLPPPSVLREFDLLVPNGAQRIFDQFEREATHRRELENKQLHFTIRNSLIGQLLAGIYAVCAFGVTGYAIYAHADWLAAILGGGTIVGGIVAFLRQKE